MSEGTSTGETCSIANIQLSDADEFKVALDVESASDVCWEVKDVVTGETERYEGKGSTYTFSGSFIRPNRIYAVRARIGEGRWSEWKDVVPYASIDGSKARGYTNNKVNLRWTKVAGTSEYIVVATKSDIKESTILKYVKGTTATIKVSNSIKGKRIIVCPVYNNEMARLPGYVPYVRIR